MTNVMKPYIDLGKRILEDSDNCSDRTGTGTWSLFGQLLEFDTRLGAPFLTERKLPLRSVAGELLWFLEGSVDVTILREQYKCNFWNEWSSEVTNTIGPMYGKQWRDANGVDQLANVIMGAVETPDSRRLVVDSWMPDVIPGEKVLPSANPQNGIMALAPCHYAYQIRLYDDNNDCDDEGKSQSKWVDLMFQLRSSDYFLGLPNNIASYHMLQVMIAAYLTDVTGILHKSRWLKTCLGDVHIYKNHVDACKELFERKPSTQIPLFKTDMHFGILKYYLGDNQFYLDNWEQVRGNLLKRTCEGISGYEPGESISGARNV